MEPQKTEIDALIQFFSSGKISESIQLANTFQQQYPNHFLGWLIEGCAMAQAGRHQEALAPLHSAVNLAPQNPDVHFNLGLALLGGDQFQDAEQSFKETLRLEPRHIPARSSLANALKAMGHVKEAIDTYRNAIQIGPQIPELHFNLGLALQEDTLLNESVSAFLKSIRILPVFSLAYYNLGHSLRDLERIPEAEAAYRTCICLSPHKPDAYIDLGNLLRLTDRKEGALASYKSATLIRPHNARVHSNLGNVLKELRQYRAAERAHRRALVFAPGEGEIHINYGNALKETARLEDATKAYRNAICCLPENARVHMNLGNTLYELGLPKAAEAAYEEAIRLKPDFAEAYWNQGLAHLLHGSFETGWALYEWRFKHHELGIYKKKTRHPEWNGKESLLGKTILLYSEQGSGDAIQFCRYALALNEQGARVILEVPALLKGLLSFLSNVTVITTDDPPPEYDVHFPLMSLPWAFQTTAENIPFPERYLKATPSKISAWASILERRQRPRIGLVVSGNPGHSQDHHRSIPLKDVVDRLSAECDYVLLQKEVRPEDLEAAKTTPNLTLVNEQIKDYEDTAALCCLMDLVICVDTSVAHLAAALGVETWILLPIIPDWRWLLKRQDSPWYRSVRLYRQVEDRNWNSVLDVVVADIKRKNQSGRDILQPARLSADSSTLNEPLLNEIGWDDPGNQTL